MELRQLRYLIGIHEAGGVLAASRILHVAQPALSQSMAALEAELGARLFVRSNRGMSLTAAGQVLLEHARVVLADVERARDAVQQSQQDLRGEVVIGLPTTVALVATLPILQTTRLRYPGIKLKIIESHSGYLIEWLRAGRLDISVTFLTENDASLLQLPLLEERLAVISAPTSALPRAGLTLKALAARPLLLPSQEHGLRRIVDAACRQAGVSLQVVAEIDSLPNIKKAVQAGVALTILSPGAVADEVAAGLLRMAPLIRPHISRKVSCTTSMTRPSTPASAAVRDVITEQIGLLVDQGIWPAQRIAAADRGV
ncbi:LysR substrate-binding domain-containing protein [Bordetella genomosp. 12]|uniref:Transcriptional regulator n=1 Tax=Bordetella genomosp. 12 TaxID=463035 RepID=A0A261VL44_9BORD|nr:LysR substrate-binding domain-containing protein [Bordetella genomosp. 12]OZI74854.1 transcriptional regulator [Bordetella genomosp. 12]